ncbi:hypothetical protein F5Y09DRAFT_338076 [Xylaria sp. FL1042]|nr:hypothetical protein F5Y09DRAFT_338076 [Xylaria sp. FL1042]
MVVILAAVSVAMEGGSTQGQGSSSGSSGSTVKTESSPAPGPSPPPPTTSSSWANGTPDSLVYVSIGGYVQHQITMEAQNQQKATARRHQKANGWRKRIWRNDGSSLDH